MITKRRIHRLIFGIVLVIALAACGADDGEGASTTTPETTTTVDGTMVEPDTVVLTQMYGCGHGFWVGNEDQTTALLIQPTAAADDLGTDTVELPSMDWRATLMFGRDLFANWCDDVLEEGEPVAEVLAEGEVMSGRLTPLAIPALDMDCSGIQAEMEISDLTVEISGVTYTIADDILVNDSWGCFAG